MSKDYKSFQMGWVILIPFPIIQIFLTLSYVYQWGNNPLPFYGFISFTILFASIMLLFYGMSTKVNGKYIIASFGVGLIKKKIEIAEIQKVFEVKNPFYYGLGIKIIPNGMLYNISGTKAIELHLKNTHRIIRIGCSVPDVLINEIERRMS